MEENNQDLIELAKRKRYMFLLEKMSRGSLTSREMKEFEELHKYFHGKPIDVVDGTVDIETLALYLEKSVRMIRNYVKKGMPVIRNTQGEIFRFRVSEVFKWVYGASPKEKDRWDTEFRKNRAKLSRLDLREREGALIPFAEHVSIIKNQVRGIRVGFLRLPKYIAPKLYQQEPRVISELLDNEIRYIINQFSGAGNADKSNEGNIKDS